MARSLKIKYFFAASLSYSLKDTLLKVKKNTNFVFYSYSIIPIKPVVSWNVARHIQIYIIEEHY